MNIYCRRAHARANGDVETHPDTFPCDFKLVIMLIRSAHERLTSSYEIRMQLSK
jgi:hypothetical protein